MMTTIYVCQGGCGTFEADAAKLSARGFVNEKLYCPDCLIEIDAYLKARDDLHTRLAEDWLLGLAALQERHGKNGRVLPDG